MFQKLCFGLAMLALATAGAAETHRITLFQPSMLAGTELKPGDYKLEVRDSKVIISQGKQSVEAPVKVESADTKYASTSVRYSSAGGKYQIQEIRLGNTKAKLVVQEASGAGL